MAIADTLKLLVGPYDIANDFYYYDADFTIRSVIFLYLQQAACIQKNTSEKIAWTSGNLGGNLKQSG